MDNHNHFSARNPVLRRMNEIVTSSVVIESRYGVGRSSIVPSFSLDGAADHFKQSEISRDDISGHPIEAAMEYWDALRGDNIAPTRQEFRLEDLPTKLIPSISVIDFVGDPIDYYYRFFGSNMVSVAGMEMTGKYYFADNVQGYGYISAKLFPRMIKNRKPLITESRWESIRGRIFETTSVRLPLINDQSEIVTGVTVSSWNNFS